MKPANTILGSLVALGLTTNLAALPQDPTPVHGQVQIENGANFVQILQQTPQAIINWGQFNIGLGESVRFLQPGQQAAILNRVTGIDPSLIQGTLQANGRVFLLNPNGILFGPNSVVDVGSFTASTLKMSNEDFLNGTYNLTQYHSLPLAALTNQGTIRVAEGGFVVLVSPLLDNQGMIVAQSGHVNLGATTQATFSVDGRGLVQFVVPDGFDPQFQGGGQGGTVLLQPGQMSQLLSQVVTNPTLVEAGSFQSGSGGQVWAHGAEGVLLNSGVISTDSRTGNGGSIRLDSSQATILPSGGRLSADSQLAEGGDVRLLSAGRTVGLGSISAAANGTGGGGFAEVSGKDLWLLGTVNVSSAQGRGGTILLDPTDITIIDGAGGTFDPQLPSPNGAGAGTVSVSAMQGQSAVQLIATNNVVYNGTGFNLGATSLTVEAGNDILFTTSGDIRASTLNLNATRDVIIAGTGGYTLQSSATPLAITGGRHVALTAPGYIQLLSPNQSSVAATNGDLTISTGQSQAFFPDARRTDLVAGRNLTITASDARHAAISGDLYLSGQNITLQSTNAGGLDFRVGRVNATAGQDFLFNATNGNGILRSVSGPLNVTAGDKLEIRSTAATAVQSDGDKITLSGSSVEVRGASEARFTSAQGANVTATDTDVDIRATNGFVYLRGGAGTVNVTASRDVFLTGGSGYVDLESSAATRVQAGRDISISSSQGQAFFPDAPRTDLAAGRNLTIIASDARHAAISGDLYLSGQNVTLQSTNAGGLDFRVGSVNATAGQDFLFNATNGNGILRSVSGPLNVTAGGKLEVKSIAATTLQSDAGKITLTAPSVDVLGVAEVRFNSSQGANVTATDTDVDIRASNGFVYLRGGAGTVNVTAPRDIFLTGGSGYVDLESSAATRVQAGRDIAISSTQGQAFFPDAPRTDLVAGRNLKVTASNVRHAAISGGVFLNAGNVTLESTPTGGLDINVGSVNVTAAQDFVGRASNGDFRIRSSSGPLNVSAAGNVSFAPSGNASLRSDTAGLTVTGANVALSNVALSAGNNGALNVTSSGNLSVGALATDASAQAYLTGANITVNSMQNVSGGNYTITTPGNLTELTPATGPPQLAALNITAGRVFNLNAPNLGFSIPQTGAGNLTALVTGGNETTVNPVQAASFRNFGTPDIDPGHIDFQTGDIYVDGIQVYGGLKPPDPPGPPPSPPPTPNPPPEPLAPVDIPVTPEQALQRENALTPEERSQILAQSNLALGNLGSFSRVLSDSEREHLTTRHDSLHQTWSLDPFSPTLALTVPGGVPPVDASELAQLQALLMMSSPADDPEDKNRQAYNVIVDQELREIWEIRYWRHLLEHFIIWEDRE